jgi:hypothetical protein
MLLVRANREVTVKAQTVLAVASAVAFAALGPAAAEGVRGSCGALGPMTVDFKTGTQDAMTISTTFVDVPRGSLNFTTGAPGCAIVHLSASSSSDPVMEVQVVLDDTTLASPGPIGWTAEGSFSSVFSFEYILPDVYPSGLVDAS